ncbi:MAG: molybdenum cofactor guanylyltransferase MobA [Alphaproteobacteria bacterium]|nr:molybdenum cofactor guanylyltransferase MobA [Alphaproteobacteria bacterium]
MIVAGVLLAGGLSRRMGGGDKSLRVLAGATILERVIARARSQVVALVLNANGDPARFEDYGLPVVADSIPDFAGPLAGVLAGLDWAAASVAGATHVASFATDAPFLPANLVARLADAVKDGRHDLACAASDGRSHPVFGLWPLALREDLRAALGAGMRKVDQWTARHRLAVVEFAARPYDPFFNANTPDDLSEGERVSRAADAARRTVPG